MRVNVSQSRSEKKKRKKKIIATVSANRFGEPFTPPLVRCWQVGVRIKDPVMLK